MTDLNSVLSAADEGLDASIDRMFDLVRIASVSTDPAFKPECRKTAETIAADLTSLGFDTSVRDTPGHPMVVAHYAPKGVVKPHVLFYGHYDVQPPDPLDKW